MVDLIIILSFLTGLLIPFLSRRFAKFMPADSATALVMLWHFPKFPQGLSPKYRLKFKHLWLKLAVSSIICSMICGGLALFFFFKTDAISASGLLFFCLMMIMIAFIDARFYLLPDVLTVPLLILGFSFTYFAEHITLKASIYGAGFGYLIPTLAGVLMFRKYPRALGGGDIKILAALGSWLGITGLNLTIMFSAFLFIIYALIRRKKIGPYGPFIAIASILIIIMQFLSSDAWINFLRI